VNVTSPKIIYPRAYADKKKISDQDQLWPDLAPLRRHGACLAGLDFTSFHLGKIMLGFDLSIKTDNGRETENPPSR
jgi:hypothetical protein